jgi:hypothetical protein
MRQARRSWTRAEGVVSGSGAEELLSPLQMALLVTGIGLVVTLLVSWTAWTLNRHNEHRLLEVQTRQAGAVIDSTILVQVGRCRVSGGLAVPGSPA